MTGGFRIQDLGFETQNADRLETFVPRLFFLMIVATTVAPAVHAALPVQKPKVQEIYQGKCQPCHGPEGHSPIKGAGLSFADGEWKHGNRLQDITRIITQGVPGTAMVSFKGQLTSQEILAMARYVRSLDKNLKSGKNPK
jgi:mono/diheme cytochrome c family protein